MSIATVALGAAEKRLPKVIDARTHGIIDYCHAAFFFGMAIYCARQKPAGRQGCAGDWCVHPGGIAAHRLSGRGVESNLV